MKSAQYLKRVSLSRAHFVASSCCRSRSLQLFSRKIAKSIPVKKTAFKTNRLSFRIISFIIVGFRSFYEIFQLIETSEFLFIHDGSLFITECYITEYIIVTYRVDTSPKSFCHVII